jgi:hypothetical protein
VELEGEGDGAIASEWYNMKEKEITSCLCIISYLSGVIQQLRDKN